MAAGKTASLPGNNDARVYGQLNGYVSPDSFYRIAPFRILRNNNTARQGSDPIAENAGG